MENVVLTGDLSKKYGDCTVVDKVSMHVPEGRIYGLLGRNGAGKTTIMKIILGLVHPSFGQVDLFEKEFRGFDKQLLSRIGSTIESPAFYPNLNAFENLKVFACLRGKVDRKEIENALNVVGLPLKDKKVFGKFSMGMKQRLAIANAIMHDPELLILDEPTNGLDPIGISEMRELISKLSREYGKTILISSHQLSEIEQVADVLGIIHEGKLLDECSMAELRERETQCIKLRTTDLEKTSRFLTDELQIYEFKEKCNGTIEIRNMSRSTAELNRALVNAGIDVSEIRMQGRNLEAYFKELTGGVGIA